MCVLFGFRIFCCFRMLSGSKINSSFFGIHLNSATIASEKCHYCKVKQAILTSKIGTIPVLKWLHSDSTKSLFHKSSNLLTQQDWNADVQGIWIGLDVFFFFLFFLEYCQVIQLTQLRIQLIQRWIQLSWGARVTDLALSIANSKLSVASWRRVLCVDSPWIMSSNYP